MIGVTFFASRRATSAAPRRLLRIREVSGDESRYRHAGGALAGQERLRIMTRLHPSSSFHSLCPGAGQRQGGIGADSDASPLAVTGAGIEEAPRLTAARRDAKGQPGLLLVEKVGLRNAICLGVQDHPVGQSNARHETGFSATGWSEGRT
jgi:hypothetical protein